jgi:hypothetical protein
MIEIFSNSLYMTYRLFLSFDTLNKTQLLIVNIVKT